MSVNGSSNRTAVDGDSGNHLPWGWQLAFACALFVMFIVLAVLMLVIADDGEAAAWERRVYVFGAVEALVFTAIGWVFGREVHRTDAQNAREDAKEANSEARDAREEAKSGSETAAAEREKGKAMVAAIDSVVATTASTAAARGGGGIQSTGRESEAASTSGLTAIQSLAHKLYGDA